MIQNAGYCITRAYCEYTEHHSLQLIFSLQRSNLSTLHSPIAMSRSDHNAPETLATRFLRQHHTPFSTHLYNYEDHGGTKVSSRELNVAEHAVVKTLVMEDESRQPLVVLMHGDRKVSTKSSRARPATNRSAPATRRSPSDTRAIWSEAHRLSEQKDPAGIHGTQHP